MSVIDLSSAWVTAMLPRLFRNDSSGGTGGNPTSSAGAGLLHAGQGYSGSALGTIYLMKGTIPASATVTANINARASDILATFGAGSVSSGDFVTSQLTVNPAVISTQYVAASASGTATWFWWIVPPTLGSGNRDTAATPIHQIIGTVGATGTGSDLELVSTTITAGEQYRILNLRILFPTTWTY